MTQALEHWVPAKPCKGVTLHPDGSYTLGSMDFDQSNEHQQTILGDIIVDKLPGEGQPLFLRAPEATHAYKFENGQWLMKDWSTAGVAPTRASRDRPVLAECLYQPSLHSLRPMRNSNS